MKTAVVFEDGKCTVNIRHMEYRLQQKQQLWLIKISIQMLQHYKWHNRMLQNQHIVFSETLLI